MPNANTNTNPSPEFMMHWQDEQSSAEQQELDALYQLYGMTAQEKRELLLRVMTDITSAIVQAHAIRVKTEIAQLERWFNLSVE